MDVCRELMDPDFFAECYEAAEEDKEDAEDGG
jgi:hypothetical protein